MVSDLKDIRTLQLGLFNDECRLSENDKYVLLRLALLHFFNFKDSEFDKRGYSFLDFSPTEKFLRDMYYTYCEKRKDAQKL